MEIYIKGTKFDHSAYLGWHPSAILMQRMVRISEAGWYGVLVVIHKSYTFAEIDSDSVHFKRMITGNYGYHAAIINQVRQLTQQAHSS